MIRIAKSSRLTRDEIIIAARCRSHREKSQLHWKPVAARCAVLPWNEIPPARDFSRERANR